MHTPPISVIRIAMTIATIGRLTKNSDMARSGCFLHWRTVGRDLLRGWRPLLHRHGRSFARFLYALHDHFIAGFQSLDDFPKRANALTHFHRENTYFIVVTYDCDLIAALQLVHRLLRDNHCAFFHVGDEPHFPELAGP